MTNATLAFTVNGTPYSIAVPNFTLTFDPSATKAALNYSGSWNETVSSSIGGNVLVGAVQFPVSVDLPGGIQDVRWTATFTSTQQSGLTLQWAWSAAVYSQFNTDYNALGVKPVDSNNASQYSNSDHAGTPENYKSYVTGGAMGGGGSNYTGGLSGTLAVSPCIGSGPGSWAAAASMNLARENFGVAVLNGLLYSVGGYNASLTGYDNAYLSQVEAYNPTTNTWTNEASMVIKRTAAGVAAADGKLIAAGGFNQNDGVLSSAESYDPVANSWNLVASMSGQRYFLSAATVNGIVYAVGGRVPPYDVPTGLVEAYDPVANTWTTKSPMNHPRWALALAVANGILYAIGGYNANNGGWLNYVEAYNPLTDVWTDMTAMPTARYLLAAASSNGTVYAIGGYNGAPLGLTEAYDTSANAWSTKAPMPTARYGLAAGELNGVIYAVGGDAGNGALSTVETFTP
jgi:hypothetical protein